MNLRLRLFATSLGLLIFGAGSLAGVVLWSFQSFFLRSARDDLEARVGALAESVGDLLEHGDHERLAEMVRQYGAQRYLALRVIGPDGALLATSQVGPTERTVDWTGVAGMAEALAGQSVAGVAAGVHDSDDRIFYATPLTRRGTLLGVVRLSRSLTQLQAHTRATVLGLLAALLLVIGLSAGLSAWLARSLSGPIRNMRDFAVALGRGNLTPRLSIRRSDELGELAAELNRMAERLATLESERRAFLANASHELRTPVSNVHVTLQALVSGAGEDPELRGRFLRTAVDETTRLRRLIQDLLELGRLEADQATALLRMRVALRRVVERATRAVESRALAQRLTLALRVEAEATLDVDPERVAQALLCVLDNAIKLSPAGGVIEVMARERAGAAEIVVRDEGPGIDEADLPRIFEQFYTADRSRRRGGTGLGLAIARRIVEAHGGRIDVASAPGQQGATFVITLPLATPAAT